MHPDFVEVYDHAIDAATCRQLIDRFEASGQARRGVTGSGVDVAVKDSWDIPLDAHPGWADAQQKLNDAVFAGFKRYLRRYPHAALAPAQLKIADPGGGPAKALDAHFVSSADDAVLGSIIMTLFRPGSINLQKYFADRGAYPYWHCELYPSPRFDHAETLHRVVLWTIYLNDTFDEGETEFLHQGRKIVPKTGSLLIAPTAYTHTHRGNMPKGGDKYIATSWILFQRTAAAPPVPGAAVPATQG